MHGITDSDGHEFEQAPGVTDGQGSPVCAVVHRVAKSQTTEVTHTVNIQILCHFM